jgi:6-phosphogluconolactonase
MPQVHTFPDLDALSAAAADAVAALLIQAVQDYGEASIALAGGGTPRKLYELLAARHADDVPWQSVHFFWGDERCVPPDNPASNYAMAQAALLSRVPVWLEKIHRMLGEDQPQMAATRYGQLLQALFEDQLGDGAIVFDIVLLGLGPDGHTASLFPGDPALEAVAPCVAVDGATGNPPGPRLTLTLPVLNAARNVLFLVSGAEKAPVVQAILGATPGSSAYPAARIQPLQGELHWYVDSSVAS